MTRLTAYALFIAAGLAVSAPAAFAQQDGPMPIGIDLGAEQKVDPATKEKREKIDAEYRSVIRQVQTPENAPRDPWANMRGPEEKAAAATAAKPAKKKAKVQ